MIVTNIMLTTLYLVWFYAHPEECMRQLVAPCYARAMGNIMSEARKI